MNTDKLEISAAEVALRNSTQQVTYDLDQLREKVGETERIVHWPKERMNRASHWLDEKLTPEDRKLVPRMLGGLAFLWLVGRFFR